MKWQLKWEVEENTCRPSGGTVQKERVEVDEFKELKGKERGWGTAVRGAGMSDGVFSGVSWTLDFMSAGSSSGRDIDPEGRIPAPPLTSCVTLGISSFRVIGRIR